MRKIEIKDKKLRLSLQDDRLRQRLYGTQMAEKIRLRMNALAAAESLADLWPPMSGPERCHELRANEAGTFSIDLAHPYRLLFRPIDIPALPDGSDERQRWSAITSIEILGIKNTHG